MNQLSRIVIVVLAIFVVALAMTTLAFSKRSQDLSYQLERTQSDLQRRKGRRMGPPSSAEERLLQSLNEQEEINTKLREDLARLKQPKSSLAPQRPAMTNAPPADPPARGGPGGAWMERLRQEDPERYKQIVEQREQRRKATDQWFQDKIAELDQQAQTAPSQDEAQLAGQIADTLAKLNDLRSQWAAVRDLPDDQRREVAQQLQADTRETYSALNDLRTRYQDIQFGKALGELGLNDPKTIEAGIKQLDKVLTDSNNLMPSRGGGPGGGDRGGGDRGGPPPPPPQ